MPLDFGAAFGVAISAFLLRPHRRRQDEIGAHRRHRWISIGNDDEIIWIAIAGNALFESVGGGLDVIVYLRTQ